MKLLTVQFFPDSCYFHYLTCKYLPQHSALEHPQSKFTLCKSNTHHKLYTNSLSNPYEYLVLCFYNFKYRVRYLRDIKPKTSMDNHSQSTFQSLCVNCRTETHCEGNQSNTLFHYISFLTK
jgi:hypothetical protein